MFAVFSPFSERRIDTLPNTGKGLVDSAGPCVSIRDNEDTVQNLPSAISEDESSYEALTFPGDGLLDRLSEPTDWTRSAAYCDLDEDYQESILQNDLPQEAIEREGDTFVNDKGTTSSNCTMCCKFTGPLAFTIIGSIVAFLSGLIFTLNNFLVKATRADFGEVLAVRCLIQIPLMGTIAILNGNSFLPTTWRKRIMLCVIAILGGFTMLTTFACVRFMPVADAITLIFTNPFFTMLFAAVFLGHRLSVLKITSAMGLLAGIVLVAKPSFIFNNQLTPSQNHSSPTYDTSDLRAEYSNKHYLLYSLRTPVPSSIDRDDYYFIGALIALSNAVICAANQILIAKVGKDVSTTIQLFYIAIAAMVIAGLCTFIDEKDRFFTTNITQITAYEWGICVAVACVGIFGFWLFLKSLLFISPTIVSTLRTSEIVLAFIAQIAITNTVPAAIDVLGAMFIFVAAVILTIENQIVKTMKKCCITCHHRSTSKYNVQTVGEDNLAVEE